MIYFDIETIPSKCPKLYDRISSTISHPKAIKKQETINEWNIIKKPKAIKDAIAKTSFDGGRGHVCTIALLPHDDQVSSLSAKTVEEEPYIIEKFFSYLIECEKIEEPLLVGHNIIGFDIPFITKRAICLGIPLPDKSIWPRNLRPYGGNKGVFDTMIDWDSNRDKWVSLDDLADILGLGGKGDFDGSMVAEAWDMGQHVKIAEYCKDDVRLVRKIYHKFLKAGW